MQRGGSALFSVLARAPMVRLALPLATGIALEWSGWFPVWSIGLLLAIATIILVPLLLRRAVHARRWMRGLAVSTWFLCFGVFWGAVRDPLARADHVAVDGTTEGERLLRITAINGISEKVIRADAEVLAALDDGRAVRRTGSIMLALMRKPGVVEPVPGDELVVRSVVEPITRIPDPGGFDRRAWAASRGLYHESFAGPDQWAVVGHGWRWTDLFEPTRDRVSAWLVESGLQGRERALVKALVLGLRDELDGDQRDAFVRSGTIHVLAVSGTHVGFIYVMLLFMTKWWGHTTRARWVRGAIVLLALWGYAGLTEACPSVLRATIMFSLFTIAGMTERQNEPLNSLFAAALVLLLWDPHMLVEIGFQLSFLAVLGIILFYGPLVRSWVPNNRILGHLWSLTALSLAAQVFTTPLSLHLFHAFPVWFLPANLIVVTAAGVAVYGAVALLVLFRVPVLGPLVVLLLTVLLRIVDVVTDFFAQLPLAYPSIRTTLLDTLVLYALVILIAVGLLWRWRPAWGYALGAVAVLLSGWAYRAGLAHDRVAFTVYDDRRSMQAAMQVGRDLVLYVADTLEGSDWTRKKIERHGQALGLTERGSIATDMLRRKAVSTVSGTVCGGGSWSAPGLTVRFHTEADVARVGPHSDVLVLHDLRYLRSQDLEALAVGCDRIILAGGLPWKLRSFVRSWCDDHGIPCHDIKEQGAFQFEAPST